MFVQIGDKEVPSKYGDMTVMLIIVACALIFGGIEWAILACAISIALDTIAVKHALREL